jgi:cobalt-zinc-cadmium efflux system protein
MKLHFRNRFASRDGPRMKWITSRLALSLWLTLAFMVVEFAAGLAANSLALITDAAHNLTDVMALGLSWYAVRLTQLPSNSDKTYGYHRAGILAALVNSTALTVVAIGVMYWAYRRFLAPPEIRADILIGVGLVALVVNLFTALWVRRGSESDLNVRSAFVHLMGDVASTSGAVVAGIMIYLTGANWLDPLVSVLIGLLILYNAWGILRESVDILLEATPRDVDMQRMVDDLLQIEGVLGVHDLHVWSLTQGLRTMSAHVLTDDISVSAGSAIQNRINDLLAGHYHISHATLQLECVGCDPDGLYCDINGVIHHHEYS